MFMKLLASSVFLGYTSQVIPNPYFSRIFLVFHLLTKLPLDAGYRTSFPTVWSNWTYLWPVQLHFCSMQVKKILKIPVSYVYRWKLSSHILHLKTNDAFGLSLQDCWKWHLQLISVGAEEILVSFSKAGLFLSVSSRGRLMDKSGSAFRGRVSPGICYSFLE